MCSPNEKNMLIFQPSQNTVSPISPINTPLFLETDFDIFNDNPELLSWRYNHLYNPSPISLNISNDLDIEPHNGILFQSSNMDIPNDFNILDINPSQNDKDYYAQKIDIEKENAIQLEGKFFLNFILIPLETDGIKFTFNYKEEEKKKKFQVENNTLNKKRKRSNKKKKKKIYYKNFKREDLNKIIQESDLLPPEFKKEIYKPNINKFIAILKDSPCFFKALRNFTFKDIYTFGKETEELQRLNDEKISDFLEFCQKIGEEILTKI